MCDEEAVVIRLSSPGLGDAPPDPGEARLARAVLGRALMDLGHPDPIIRKEALEWIYSQDEDLRSWASKAEVDCDRMVRFVRSCEEWTWSA